MSRKGKITYAVIAIILSYLASIVGLWLLAGGNADSFYMKWLVGSILVISPCQVTLAFLNILKRDSKEK